MFGDRYSRTPDAGGLEAGRLNRLMYTRPLQNSAEQRQCG